MSNVTTIRLPATRTNRGSDGTGRKTWLKMLTKVDPKAINGSGFEGDWLDRGKLINADEVPEDSILLEGAGNNGSAKNPCMTFVLWQRVGTEFIELACCEGDEWAFEMREIAIAALQKSKTVDQTTTSASARLMAAFAELKSSLEAEKLLRLTGDAIDDAISRLAEIESRTIQQDRT